MLRLSIDCPFIARNAHASPWLCTCQMAELQQSNHNPARHRSVQTIVALLISHNSLVREHTLPNSQVSAQYLRCVCSLPSLFRLHRRRSLEPPRDITLASWALTPTILAYPGQNKAATMEVPDYSYGARLLPALHAALASSRDGHERTLTRTLVKILNDVIGEPRIK